jgi:FtsH-binding integral membrane protein
MEAFDFLAVGLLIAAVGDVALVLYSSEKKIDRILRLVLAIAFVAGAVVAHERIANLTLGLAIALVIVVGQGALMWRSWRAVARLGRAAGE